MGTALDIITAFRIFSAVVETNSFSAAGRRLRLSRSVVSRHIEGLEADLGTRLINRTTRRLSLTDAGKKYHDGARQILQDVDKLQRSLIESQKTLRGRIRVSAPIHFGEQRVLPIVLAFLQKFPEIDVELSLSKRRVDIIAEGMDLVVCTAPELPDSSFITRRISTNRFVLCAAPAYCAAHGMPKAPEDLATHSCIASIQQESDLNWTFVSPEGTVQTVPVMVRLMVNSSSAQVRAVKAGVGIALLPEHVVEQALQWNELVRLLPEFENETYSIYVVYPHKDLMPARTRKFLDFLVKDLARV